MRRNLIPVSFMILLLFAAWGCAPAPRMAVERPDPISVEEGTARLRNRTEHWRSYQARLQIRGQSSGRRFNFQTVVLAKLPDQFRLEAFKLGQTVGVLVLNEGRASLWIPSENVIYTADRAENLTEHLLGIAVPLDVLSYGLVASIPSSQLDALQILTENSIWRGYAAGPRPEWGFNWEFETQPLALRSTYIREGAQTYRITYEPAVDVTPQQVPRKISLTSPQWQMEINVNELIDAQDLPGTAFAPDFPAGVRRVSLD
jgi:outer membrane biogenesis lipoprotein LolB